MKTLLLLLLLPTFSFAQKGFFGGSMQMEIPKGQSPSLGLRLAGGANVNNFLLIGGTVGFTKFSELDNVIIPIGATLMAGIFDKKIFPVVIAEPTYGVYPGEKDNVGSETKGGFSFYGGGGIGFTSKGGKGAGLVTVGYSTYSLETNGFKSTLDGVAIRITFLGK